MAGDTRLALESLRHNCDAEMAFARWMASGVARMLIAFVNHIKYCWLESRSKFLLKRLADRAQSHRRRFSVSG